MFAIVCAFQWETFNHNHNQTMQQEIINPSLLPFYSTFFFSQSLCLAGKQWKTAVFLGQTMFAGAKRPSQTKNAWNCFDQCRCYLFLFEYLFLCIQCKLGVSISPFEFFNSKNLQKIKANRFFLFTLVTQQRRWTVLKVYIALNEKSYIDHLLSLCYGSFFSFKDSFVP